ncbi:hypothetical protein, partial [uncultured Acinetobacter sp.]|uniref:hypothetical protein n=1 Tax=uncultured Acinetobacter sp. TaxID=165433 RepID=UPI0025987358
LLLKLLLLLLKLLLLLLKLLLLLLKLKLNNLYDYSVQKESPLALFFITYTIIKKYRIKE